MLEQGIPRSKPMFLIIVFGFLFTSAVVVSEIPLGSTISVEGNNYWVSSNGYFAVGFFNHTDQPNQYSVGIRFNSNSIPIQKQTVVWIAGADVLVGCNSFLQLTQAGDLILFDSSKRVTVWTSSTSHLSVASAVLLDNGNLVLLNQGKAIVWQSFLTPSDTLLPGQNLSVSQSLRAASRNSVSSYYSLCIVSGQLKLKWETNIGYWSSGTPFFIFGAIFTSDGALKLLNQRFKPVWSVFGDDHNDSSVKFRFLRLDVDGNLRMYSWVEGSKSWRIVWQAVENQCNVFATCGFCGICVFTENGSSICKCPFRSTMDPNSKCLAPYKQKCDSGDTMITLNHTFLYGIYPPNDSVILTSLDECKKSCLVNPLCTSVTVTNDGTAQCLTKKTQYITGYTYPSLRSISFVKMCLDPVAVFPRSLPTSSASTPPPSPFLKQTRRFCIPCLIGAALGTILAFVVIQLGIGFCIFKRRKSMRKTASLTYMDPNSRGLIILSYSEIKDLTENFKHDLGPKLFKGVLPNDRSVVIKDVKAYIKEKQFRYAVSVIGNIHHKNLVKLEGYCCESQHRFLIYEFAKNSSVDKWIEDAKLKERMTWRKRMDICLGVARAIAYLHTGCREFVSHGNLKWENVVLGDELEAKVTEFGLGNINSGCCGSGGLAEQDVASFGKMMVILVTGSQGEEELCEWAYKEWVDGRVEELVDPSMEGVVDGEEVERTLRIAFWCMQADERLRPSMGEVVNVLEGSLTVDHPPPPYVLLKAVIG